MTPIDTSGNNIADFWRNNQVGGTPLDEADLNTREEAMVDAAAQLSGAYTDSLVSQRAPVDGAIYLSQFGAVYGNSSSNAATNNQALADAAAAMVAQGRSRLHLGAGDLYATAWPSALTTIPHLSLVGDHPEATRLIYGTVSGVQPFVKITGTYAGGTAALTVDAVPGATTLTFVSTSGFAAGDTLLVGSNSAFSVESPTAFRGEQVRIKSVDSVFQVTLHGYIHDTYALAASASAIKITPNVGVTLEDWTLVNATPNSNTGKGVELDACHRFHIDRFHTEGIDGPGVVLTNCVDGQTTTEHRDHTDNSGANRFGYGLMLHCATQNVECHVVARNCRHAFTADGEANQRGVVRYFTVSGVAEACTSGAWDTHANSEHGVFDAVVAHDSRYMGVQLRGKRMKVVGADIDYCSAGVIMTDDANGAYVGGGTTIRNIQNLDGLGSGIRIGSSDDVTIENFYMDGIARRGIHIAGAGLRLKIRDGQINNTGQANVSGFKSGIATDSGLTNATSGLEIMRVGFIRDVFRGTNMDWGIIQNSTGWSGGIFKDNWAVNVSVLSDLASSPNQSINNGRIDQGTPASFPNSVTIKNVSGPVTDGSFTVAPPNGTIVLSRKRIARRVAGIWEIEPPNSRTPWLPTGAVAEVYPRSGARGDNGAILVSGRLHLVGGMVLPADQDVSSVTFVSGTTAMATGTHQWFCLTDRTSPNPVILAVTADDGATAWAADTAKTLSFAAPYTPLSDLPVFVGIMVAATTVPSLAGVNNALGTVAATGFAMSGASTTGLTSPPAAGSTVAFPASASTHQPYAYVS
jgi:hypothetical protein